MTPQDTSRPPSGAGNIRAEGLRQLFLEMYEDRAEARALAALDSLLAANNGGAVELDDEYLSDDEFDRLIGAVEERAAWLDRQPEIHLATHHTSLIANSLADVAAIDDPRRERKETSSRSPKIDEGMYAVIAAGQISELPRITSRHLTSDTPISPDRRLDLEPHRDWLDPAGGDWVGSALLFFVDHNRVVVKTTRRAIGARPDSSMLIVELFPPVGSSTQATLSISQPEAEIARPESDIDFDAWRFALSIKPSEPPPLLGGVIFDLERRLLDTPTEAEQHKIQTEVDALFRHRYDYKLWRLTFRQFSRGGEHRPLLDTDFFTVSSEPPIFDLVETYDRLSALKALGGAGETEAWGIVGVMAANIGRALPGCGLASLKGSRVDGLALLNLLERLPVRRSTRWGCAVALIIVYLKVLEYVRRVDPLPQDSPVIDLAKYAARGLAIARTLLRDLDPDFYEGGALNLEDLAWEEREDHSGRIVPLDTVTHGLNQFAWALQQLAWTGKTLLSTTTDFPEWKSDAFLISCAAWRIRRWQRFHYETIAHSGPSSQKRLNTLYYYEMRALSHAGKMAHLAGDYAKGAGLFWAFQILFKSRRPIPPAKKSSLQIENWQFAILRQVGISPDPYFSGRDSAATDFADEVESQAPPKSVQLDGPNPDEVLLTEQRHDAPPSGIQFKLS